LSGVSRLGSIQAKGCIITEKRDARRKAAQVGSPTKSRGFTLNKYGSIQKSVRFPLGTML